MISNDLSLVLWLHTIKLNLSHIIILQRFVEGTGHLLGRHKLITELQNLGHIWDGEVTPKGKELMDQVNSWKDVWQPGENLKFKGVERDPRFDEWYQRFPATSRIEYKGQIYPGTRSLRTTKNKCEAKYVLILREGKVTHEQLMECLQIEINDRLAETERTGKSDFAYMKATASYLSSRQWENYLGRIGKENVDTTNRVKINVNAY